MYLQRFRPVHLFISRCYYGGTFRLPSMPKGRPHYFSIFVPFGLSIKNRFFIQCQQPQAKLTKKSDMIGSRLLYYDDVLEKENQAGRQRNFILSVILWIYRLIRITIRLIYLSIIFGPLLITYPFVRRHEKRLANWRLRALKKVNQGGAAIIKLAQWASTRRDLFSKEFCDLFSQLHTSASTHEWSRTETALRKILGDDWRNYFLDLDEKPRGSGCVAQVYKAKLNYIAIHTASPEIRSQFDSNEKPWVDVAIKVTHPGVRQRIVDDLTILWGLAKVAQWIIPQAKYVDVTKSLNEFRLALTRQLDMRYEGDALRIFTYQFEDDKSIRFPKPLLQSEDVLIETFEDGQHISNYLSSPDAKLKKRLAKLGMNALLKMVFVNNFVHGDLHPGNILVQEYDYKKSKDGLWTKLTVWIRSLFNSETIVRIDDMVVEKRMRLVFLDAGISIRLSEPDLKNLRAVFKAVADGDGARAGELILINSPQERCKDREAFKRDVQALVTRARSTTVSLEKMDVSNLLSDLLSTVSRHQVSLEPNFTCIVLAVVVLEGLGRSLYPDLDLLKAATPVLNHLI